MKQLTRFGHGGLSVVFLIALCAGAFAAEGPEGAVTVSGKVLVTKRDPLGPVAATFAVPKDKTYELVMDEKGRSLAGVMHGQTPEIHAVTEGDSIRVLGYVDERVNAGHEFWRRMRCLACVVLPATANAGRPPDLQGAAEVAGRPYFFKRRFTAWARDEKFLWVAADNEILQFDLAKRALVRSLGRTEGLPDQLVYQLASTGKTLWIVYRGGVATLEVEGDRVTGRPQFRCRYAQVAVSGDAAWVIADTGTFRFAGAADTPEEQPALPTAKRIATAVENGIWTPHWARRTAHFIANPAVLGGRLYSGSWGDLYELADGKWRKIADGGWEQIPHGDSLWFISFKGLNKYDPQTGKTETFEPPEAGPQFHRRR